MSQPLNPRPGPQQPPYAGPPYQTYPAPGQPVPPQYVPPMPGQPVHPGYAPRPQPSAETRRDVEAAWAARLELGLSFEEHIAAGLAERVEQLAAYRAAELRADVEAERRRDAVEQSGRSRQFALGIVSVVMGIPITAIAGHDAGMVGMAISWTGIVGVNAVHALGLRRSRPARR